MDLNFFDDVGDTVIQSQQVHDGVYQYPQDQHEDEFDFSGNENNVQAKRVFTQNVNNVDNETICKIREQQERVQERLRDKSNKEYEQKLKRKEQGRRQYEQFLAQKEAETEERRQRNQQKAIDYQNIKVTNEPEQTPWKKVASNVPLKQGQHKGSKDITRMRQSIINKRDDESRIR